MISDDVLFDMEMRILGAPNVKNVATEKRLSGKDAGRVTLRVETFDNEVKEVSFTTEDDIIKILNNTKGYIDA